MSWLRFRRFDLEEIEALGNRWICAGAGAVIFTEEIEALVIRLICAGAGAGAVIFNLEVDFDVAN